MRNARVLAASFDRPRGDRRVRPAFRNRSHRYISYIYIPTGKQVIVPHALPARQASGAANADLLVGIVVAVAACAVPAVLLAVRRRRAVRRRAVVVVVVVVMAVAVRGVKLLAVRLPVDLDLRHRQVVQSRGDL